MAYLQSRAAIAVSGVTHAGWTPPNVQILINSVDRTASLLQGDSWVLTAHADGTQGLLITSKTFTPVVGHDVRVLYATPSDYLFGGTILTREAIPFTPDSADVQWHCSVGAYRWLLDRYDKILASYTGMGANAIVARLLAGWTDGGFRVGYIPSSLGDLTMDFTMEELSAGLERVAVAVDATVRIEPERIVSIAATWPEATLATVTEAHIRQGSLRYREDLTQVRTRVIFHGGGSTTTAIVSAGGTTIDVENTAPFPDSGIVLSGFSLITYTGRSTSAGPGQLTGCSGFARDLRSGDAVDVVVVATDGAKQTALATVLGGGLSGQATHYQADRRLSSAEATRRATADLSRFGDALPSLAFTYVAVQRHLRPGQVLPVAITAPIVVNGTFIVQSVTTALRGNFSGTSIEIFQSVTASLFDPSLVALIGQA